MRFEIDSINTLRREVELLGEDDRISIIAKDSASGTKCRYTFRVCRTEIIIVSTEILV